MKYLITLLLGSILTWQIGASINDAARDVGRAGKAACKKAVQL